VRAITTVGIERAELTLATLSRTPTRPVARDTFPGVLEIDSIDACRAWLAHGDLRRPPAALQALDLRSFTDFEVGDFGECLFLGCELTPFQAGHLAITGALVIRDRHDRPYSIHRRRLYDVAELFAGFRPDQPGDWNDTFDAAVYRYYVAHGASRPDSIAESLAQRLHDHSITDALDEFLDGRSPVAIMGGHGLRRADPHYATVARIARALARDGELMLSGGGPGAMEATHLGAWMAHFDDSQLDAALGVLAPRQGNPDDPCEFADADWLHRAFEVRRRWPVDSPRYESVGIPTWAYGHEPPSAFATHIAKYFANSVREDGLLAVATGGVVFTPGSAGTVQEIFQDAAQNHYRGDGPPAPMVLFGVDHWTRQLPVLPLLRSLAHGRDYADLITITDDEQEAVARIAGGRGA
jgi:predicted Rossmann-fold nucleotide-binding protein